MGPPTHWPAESDGRGPGRVPNEGKERLTPLMGPAPLQLLATLPGEQWGKGEVASVAVAGVPVNGAMCMWCVGVKCLW